MTMTAIDTGRSGPPGPEPAALLPEQFFGEARRVLTQPERRLMLAVLEEAVGTFQRHATAATRAARRELANVEAWFASEDTAWPFAFVNLCDMLGLDADAIRAGLGRWKERRRALPAVPLYRPPFRRVSGDRHRAVG